MLYDYLKISSHYSSNPQSLRRAKLPKSLWVSAFRLLRNLQVASKLRSQQANPKRLSRRALTLRGLAILAGLRD